jgi:mono/diheme cytochrome c family protein
MSRLTYVLIAMFLLLFEYNLSWGLPWSKDMKDAPSVKPQETIVEETPESSVSTAGEEPIPIPKNIGELFQAKVKAASLVNPVERTFESMEKGKVFYDLNCYPCHGEKGLGDGPVGKKFSPPAANLSTESIQKQPDGQIFLTISHGSIAMPFYRDAMSPEERWHLINYIKGALGKE